MTNPTSPKFPADIRSPLEALRDMTDRVEMMAREVATGNPELADIMLAFRKRLPYDLLTEAEQALAAQARDGEDQEDLAYFEDQRAMYRPQRV